MNGDDLLPPGYKTECANDKPAALVKARQLIYGRRRAESLAEAFSKEFNRLQEVGQ